MNVIIMSKDRTFTLLHIFYYHVRLYTQYHLDEVSRLLILQQIYIYIYKIFYLA